VIREQRAPGRGQQASEVSHARDGRGADRVEGSASAGLTARALPLT
jgi:hypothetical protein